MRRHLTRLSTAAETAAAPLADNDVLRSQLLLPASEARSLMALGSLPVLPRTIGGMGRAGAMPIGCRSPVGT